MNGAAARPTICLNMIVKNEAHVIERCLRSVRPFIDAWVIVDTGSTDGTQDLIRRLLADLPGELHERPWVDFGSNRTEAIRLAGDRWDYLYFIDADEELTLPPEWSRPPLTEEAYHVRYLHGPITYSRPSLVATRVPWRYVGVLHEYLDAGRPTSTGVLDGPAVIYRPEGARSLDPQKFRKDAQILEKAVAADPGNSRDRFYLAQSWRDAGEPEAALAHYLARAEMGDWAEEVYVSLLNAGRLMEQLRRPPEAAVRVYLRAHSVVPGRIEALVELARLHRELGEWPVAYLFAQAAEQLPAPAEGLFVEPAAHQWRAADERSIAAYWTGRHAESLALCDRLLASPFLPAPERARVAANRGFAAAALGPDAGSAVSAGGGEALDVDVAFFDDIGMPFTLEEARTRALGGSEFALLGLARALAASGLRVLHWQGHPGEPLEAREGNLSARRGLGHGPVKARCLIHHRYSSRAYEGTLAWERRFALCSDLWDDQLRQALEGLRPSLDGVVCLSEWQAAQYTGPWHTVAIPYLLPDEVYEPSALPRDPHRFFYASAALKGLAATLEEWRRLRRVHPELQAARLRVLSPGYDDPAVAAGLGAEGVELVGPRPFVEVVEECRRSAGLFYVNEFPETFCLVAALAEACGARTHVWMRRGGAIPETVRSSLVVEDDEAFERDFVRCFEAPEGTACAEPRDFRAETVVARWRELLGFP